MYIGANEWYRSCPAVSQISNLTVVSSNVTVCVKNAAVHQVGNTSGFTSQRREKGEILAARLEALKRPSLSRRAAGKDRPLALPYCPLFPRRGVRERSIFLGSAAGPIPARTRRRVGCFGPRVPHCAVVFGTARRSCAQNETWLGHDAVLLRSVRRH